jgi:WD40 repeat protein
VYYQIFSSKGAIESKCSFDENDPFTGRVFASRITPPRTVDGIKKFLLDQEKISDATDVELFASALTSESGLSDQDRPKILAQDGPGSVADDPMALIIKYLPPVVSESTNIATISNSTQSPKPLPQFSPNALLLGSHKPSQYVYAVTFSPDGRQIASCSQDNTICIWDVTSGQLAIGPITAKTNVYSVAFSPDGGHLASGCDGGPYIRIWDARTGNPVSLPFEGHTAYVLSVAYSPDGGQLASGSGDSTIRIWNARVGAVQVGPIEGHAQRVRSVAFSPDGLRLVSGGFDNTVRVWSTNTGGLVAGPFRGHSDWVYSASFSPCGRWVVSGSRDRSVRVWDTEGDESKESAPLPIWKSFKGRSGVVFGSRDKNISVRDTEDSTSKESAPMPAWKMFKGHSNFVTTAIFSPDGQQVISGSCDGTICIWGFESGQVVTTLRASDSELPDQHPNKFWSTTLSPTGDRIAAGTTDGQIYIWNRE